MSDMNRRQSGFVLLGMLWAPEFFRLLNDHKTVVHWQSWREGEPRPEEYICGQCSGKRFASLVRQYDELYRAKKISFRIYPIEIVEVA